jgi:EmrB/QacA subfamily drug resistance transporter
MEGSDGRTSLLGVDAGGGPATGGPDTTTAKWGLPVAVLVVGMFMSILDLTIVNVAIPAIQKDFGGSLEDVLWVATAYTLTLGVVVPTTGWLGDRFGLANLYVGSLVAFALGSALCGLAWNLDVLIAARILQAIPGGILPVVALTIIYRIVPSRQIGAAMGCYGFGAVVAPAVGPVLGGYLVEHMDWRLVFFINTPIGLLGAVAAYFAIPKIPRVTPDRFDGLGFVTIAIGLFAILLASSEGESWSWTGYRVLILFTVGVLALALFVVIELEMDKPLVDIRLLKRTQFTLPMVTVCLFFINMLVGSFYLPVFLQQGQGKEPFDAGLLILPQAAVMSVVMGISGLLYDRFGARWLAVTGLVVSAYGTYLLCGMSPDMTGESVIIWTIVRAAGMGMAVMPMMTASIDALPSADTNQGSVIMNTFQQVAGALGLATLGALSTGQLAQLLSDRSALSRPDPAMVAALAHPTPEQFALMYRMAERVMAEALATSYANIFLLVSLLTVLLSLAALGIRSTSTSTDQHSSAIDADDLNDSPAQRRETTSTEPRASTTIEPSPTADIPVPMPAGHR